MRIEQPRATGWGRLNPVQGAQTAWDRFSAHPIQGIMTFLAGAAAPGGSRIARSVFDRYNDSQFTQGADWLNNATQQQGNQAEAGAWGRPLDGALGAFGPSAPSYPGQGMPTAAAPWWSTPGVVGGWVAPNGIMDFLGNPDQVITPDGTGVSLPISQQPRPQAQQPPRETGAQIASGMERGWSGVMGRGANGETLIRGVSPTGSGYRYVYNGRRYGNGGT